MTQRGDTDLRQPIARVGLGAIMGLILTVTVLGGPLLTGVIAGGVVGWILGVAWDFQRRR